MPRRIQIRMACQRCRQKRAKCDGQVPCKRCDEAGEGCVYDHTRRESKDDLRVEIDRLRRCNEENDQVLQAIYSIKDVDASNAFIRELLEGKRSRRAILQDLAQLERKGGSRPLDEAGESSTAGSLGSNLDEAVCSHCLSRLPSSTMHRSASYSSDISTPTDLPRAMSASRLATPISASSFPFDGRSHTQPDRWTRTGWTVAAVRELLDALLTWDYLPFCLMCRDPFLKDYCSGSTQYCSSALVNALLALATRVVHENNDETGSPGQGFVSGSATFFEQADTIIHRNGPPMNLPDIQAIGILSLYQISCGRETEAQALAESFAARVADLCHRESPAGAEAAEYVKVRATSYCGAVSLVRILRLTMGQVLNMSPNHRLPDDSIFLDRSSCGAEDMFGTQCGSGVTPDLALDANSSPLRSLQLIPERIFQLTEWVYKFLSATHVPNGQFNTAEVMAVYTKCLDWYDGFFSLLKTDQSDSPFVLFIHMYYQFALLCLFRPVANLVLADSDIRPREILLQAAQSILALSQSYSGLFTLGRVSAFVPYFVCASGIAGIRMESTLSSSAMAGSQLLPPRRSSLATSSDISSADGFGSYQEVLTSPTAAKMPIAVHARQLLAEMSFKNRVASCAENMLHAYASSVQSSAFSRASSSKPSYDISSAGSLRNQ